MSEFIVDTIVKEEYDIQESTVDFPDDTTDEPRSKCGEVFLVHRGRYFTFVCVQCLQSFNDLPSFGEHVSIKHPLIESGDGYQHHKLKLEPSDKDKSDSMDEEDMKNMEIISDQTDDESSYLRTGVSKHSFPLPKTEPTNGDEALSELHYDKFSKLQPGEEIMGKDGTASTHDAEISFGPQSSNAMMCKYCLKTSSDMKSFHSHLRNAHLNNLYNCPFCLKSFSRREDRNRHISTHGGARSHQCPRCPNSFITPQSLQSHINSHFKVKRHACQFCGKRFARKSDVNRHEKNHNLHGKVSESQ